MASTTPTGETQQAIATGKHARPKKPRYNSKQECSEKPKQKKTGLGTVGALCTAWAEATLHTSHISGRTYGPWRELRAIAGPLTPHQLTPLHFQTIIARWKMKLSPATTHSYRAGLATLARFIGQTAGIQDLHKWVPRTRDPGPRKLIAMSDEIARLTTSAEPWMRAIITLAICQGWRMSECIRISEANWNPATGTITCTVKGGKNTRCQQHQQSWTSSRTPHQPTIQPPRL